MRPRFRGMSRQLQPEEHPPASGLHKAGPFKKTSVLRASTSGKNTLKKHIEHYKIVQRISSSTYQLVNCLSRKKELASKSSESTISASPGFKLSNAPWLLIQRMPSFSG